MCSPFEAEHFALPNMMNLNSSSMMQPQTSHNLMNNISSLTGEPMGIGIGHGMNNLQLSSVISCLSSVNLSNHTDNSAVSGNNSPLSDSGISVDNVSHNSGSNAMMNAAAMVKLHNQSKHVILLVGFLEYVSEWLQRYIKSLCIGFLKT